MLQIKLSEVKSSEELPEVCRLELMEWDQQVKHVADVVMELLCEGLGLDPGKLKETRCLETRVLAGHYYPKCPQPDLTFGIASHTDPGVLTVLLQDHIGGLQVKHDGGWVDVKPVPGALVINIGDILEIMSNYEDRSTEHRVLANPSQEARISITTFFSPGARDTLFGHISDTFLNPDLWAVHAELNGIRDAVQETETEMLQMSELNHRIAAKVLELARQIKFLNDAAVDTTKDLELGNKELSEATQRIKSSRTFLLLFLSVVAFSAIFLGWYD